MINVPGANEFPAPGPTGNGIHPAMRSQANTSTFSSQWLRYLPPARRPGNAHGSKD